VPAEALVGVLHDRAPGAVGVVVKHPLRPRRSAHQYRIRVPSQTPADMRGKYGAGLSLVFVVWHLACGSVSSEYTILGDECSVCPAGTYMDEVGQTECKPCVAGSFLSVTGSIAEDNCVRCGSGRFSTTIAAIAQDTCDACPAGAKPT